MMQKPRFKIYHLILLLIALSISILFVLRFATPHAHTGFFAPQSDHVSEERWEPLYFSLKFGLLYLIIALISLGTLISALLFFIFRDDGSPTSSS